MRFGSFSVLAFVLAVNASSAPKPPISRVESLTELNLHVLPRSTYDTNPARSSKPSAVLHSDSLRLSFSAFSQTFHLHLRPNDHLIHPNAVIIHHTPASSNSSSGSSTSSRLHRESVRAYLGHVIDPTVSSLWHNVHAFPSEPWNLGWARILIHHFDPDQPDDGLIFEGAFSVDGDIHHIKTLDNYLKSKHELDPAVEQPRSRLVIFRDSDLIGQPEKDSRAPVCSHDALDFNSNPLVNGIFRRSLGRRQGDDAGGSGDLRTNFADTIGDTTNCPKTQQVLFMGVAADCEYTQRQGGVAQATTAIINNINQASAIFRDTFNVSLGVVQLEIADPVCPAGPDPSRLWNVNCDATPNINSRLGLFSAWRGQRSTDGAGLWHLMSGCPTGSEVGVAWLGTLCLTRQVGGGGGTAVSGTAVSTFNRIEWQIVTHEIGHNFGAIHDCTQGCSFNSNPPCCPFSTTSCDADARFIMNPQATPGELAFSPCSIGNVCSVMRGNINTACLEDANNVGNRTIELQMCGNGIIETGEDCDPGPGRESACCDSQTCRFRAGAVCDPINGECCTAQCTFAPSTRVCRPSKDATCDTAETCTGNSAFCPADEFVPNGNSCGDDNGDPLSCANGLCTSNSQQCRALGASLGLRRACPQQDTSCQVSCQDPQVSNQCVILSSQLIDGSPCGFGGRCQAGVCEAGSPGQAISSWFTQNLAISIPVTIVGGLIVIYIIWFIISRCCCGSRRATPRRPQAAPHAVSPRVQQVFSTPVTRPQSVHASSGGRRLSRASTQLTNLPPPPIHPSSQLHSNQFYQNQNGHQLGWEQPPPPPGR